jgi:CheY-like chemotaxis protein
VALPPCEPEATASNAIAEPPRYRVKPGERLRILIVDDDRPVAAAVALELGDHDVVVAESGREALEILRRDKDFDVILCDLMMPEVSGMDVYEALRFIDPALLGRVVLMTGGAFTTRAGEFLSSVNAPILDKPFEPGQLHTIVNVIERRREIAEAAIATTEVDADAWRPSDVSRGKET